LPRQRDSKREKAKAAKNAYISLSQTSFASKNMKNIPEIPNIMHINSMIYSVEIPEVCDSPERMNKYALGYE